MTYSTSESFGSFASSIQKEIQYLERVVKEQQEIIEQLTGTGQPKGYVYMHPFDVSEALNAIPVTDVYRSVGKFEAPDYIINLNGRRIRKSPFIPAITQNIR